MKIIAILILALILYMPAAGAVHILAVALRTSAALMLRMHRVERSYPQRLFFACLRAFFVAVI